MRAYARSRRAGSAPTLLFSGCRDAAADRLYGAEWIDVPNLEVDVSVSRHADPERRRRVTAALRARGAEVAELLLEAGAALYVAGNATMASDVAEALLDVLAARPEVGRGGAAAALRRLEREGRFAVEAFG